MISAENKRLALKAINMCFMFNFNNQLKCNDLFGCLNRIWNSIDFERTQEQVGGDASDTAKLRKLLLLLLRDMDAERLVNLAGFHDLSEVRPLIHDDNVSRLYLGGPFDPASEAGLTSEQTAEPQLLIKDSFHTSMNYQRTRTQKLKNALLGN